MAYWMKPAEQVKMANTAIEKSFKAIKIRLGQGLEKDEEGLKALRDQFPSPKELEIMADVNSGYPFKDTLKLARMCEMYELEWLEEPVFSDDVEGLSNLRQNVNISIAGGENNYGIFEFKNLLDRECYDIIQPDATRSGGISAVKKIGALAEAHGIDCNPHVFGTGLVQTANLQVIAALPNAHYFEYGFYPTFFLLMKEGDLELQDGNVIVPMGPGLGREFDEEAAKQFLK